MNGTLKIIAWMVVLILGTGFLEHSWQKLAADAFRQAKSGNDTEAIRLYQEALELKPGEESIHYNLGTLLARNGKKEEALKYLSESKSPRQKKLSARALYNMGNTMFQGKDYGEAVKAYIQSLKLEPDNQKTKENLELALKMLKKHPPKPKKKKDKKKKKKKQEQGKNSKDRKKQKSGMSKKQVERILKSLKQDEKNTQKKVQKLNSRKPASTTVEKDW